MFFIVGGKEIRGVYFCIRDEEWKLWGNYYSVWCYISQDY